MPEEVFRQEDADDDESQGRADREPLQARGDERVGRDEERQKGQAGFHRRVFSPLVSTLKRRSVRNPRHRTGLGGRVVGLECGDRSRAPERRPERLGLARRTKARRPSPMCPARATRATPGVTWTASSDNRWASMRPTSTRNRQRLLPHRGRDGHLGGCPHLHDRRQRRQQCRGRPAAVHRLLRSKRAGGGCQICREHRPWRRRTYGHARLYLGRPGVHAGLWD